VRLLSEDERRSRALDILADGVLRLLARDGVVAPAAEPGDALDAPVHLFRRSEPRPGEEK